MNMAGRLRCQAQAEGSDGGSVCVFTVFEEPRARVDELGRAALINAFHSLVSQDRSDGLEENWVAANEGCGSSAECRWAFGWDRPRSALGRETVSRKIAAARCTSTSVHCVVWFGAGRPRLFFLHATSPMQVPQRRARSPKPNIHLWPSRGVRDLICTEPDRCCLRADSASAVLSNLLCAPADHRILGTASLFQRARERDGLRQGRTRSRMVAHQLGVPFAVRGGPPLTIDCIQIPRHARRMCPDSDPESIVPQRSPDGKMSCADLSLPGRILHKHNYPSSAWSMYL
ncbi:hypothetical protein PMIN03_011875 [Paraphaeosphaeria minitans]